MVLKLVLSPSEDPPLAEPVTVYLALTVSVGDHSGCHHVSANHTYKGKDSCYLEASTDCVALVFVEGA